MLNIKRTMKPNYSHITTKTKPNYHAFRRSLLLLAALAAVLHGMTALSQSSNGLLACTRSLNDFKHEATTATSVSQAAVTQPDLKRNKKQLGICSIVRNEEIYIREWLNHHVNKLGADHVYIYDHNSTTPLPPYIKDYLENNKVTYTHFVNFYLPDRIAKDNRTNTPAQHWAYKHCLDSYGHLYHWMAFIDVDEFVILKDEYFGKRLGDVLQDEFKAFSAVMLNWRVFGSSGHMTRPRGVEGGTDTSNGTAASTYSVLQSYTKCLPTDAPDILSGMQLHVKPIVQSSMVKRVVIHTLQQDPKIKSQYPVVFDDKSIYKQHKLDWWKSYSWHGSKIVLHHYLLKSVEEAMEKRHLAQQLASRHDQFKWKATGGNQGRQWVDAVNEAATETNEDALKYV